MRFVPRCATKAANSLPIKYILKNFKAYFPSNVLCESTPSNELQILFLFRRCLIASLLTQILNLENGMHKNFQNIPNLTIFEVFQHFCKIISVSYTIIFDS